MLDKKECLFERDEEGALIGRPMVLETIEGKPEIVVKPLTRGKLMEIFQKAKGGTDEEKIKSDAEVIRNGLVNPQLTDKEIEDLKPSYASAIVTTILSISLGVSQDKITSSAKSVLESELDLKK